MIAAAGGTFTTSVTGQILLPFIGGLLLALTIYLVRKMGKVLRGVTAAAETAATVKTEQDTFRQEIVDRLDAQDVKLAAIDSETRTNGGASLKDATKRTEQKMDVMTEKLSLHLEDAKYRQGMLDAHIAGHP